jgi:hypothetical protein
MSFGYFTLEHNSKGNLLVYRSDDNIENIDVDNLNLADYNDLEITLEIVSDYKLHLSTKGKEGSYRKKVPVKDLSNFHIFK